MATRAVVKLSPTRWSIPRRCVEGLYTVMGIHQEIHLPVRLSC